MIARAFQTCALLLGGLLPLSMANAGDDAPATTATRYTAADEAQYLARYEALMNAARQGQGLDIYDTMEPVPGARRVKPLRTATGRQRSIDAAAVTAARDYAARNQSAALLIVRDGLVQEAAYFGSTQPDSLLVSRSLAKPLTALVIGRAIALGKIRSLDQPVADFIHEWRGKPQEKMRMRHLLDMRSGFLRQSAVTDPQHILQRAYLHPRHDEVIIHDYPLVDEPGTRYEYANATSELVAPVIERATGMRYAEFVGRELLVPLGAAGGEVWVNRPGGMAHSGCCMRLPAESWLRIALLVLNDGVANGRR
jgi:CubicO group peptidase (beta-lactamase class C family)